MKKKPYIGKLYQFDRGPLNQGSSGTNGYVLDYTDDWTFIHFVDGDIFFNGYSILLNKTIKRYRELDDNNHMIHRALRNLGYQLENPGSIDLTDINSIVKTANALFPLVVIHREFRWKDECHIGGIAAVTEKTITLATIAPDAKYDGLYRINSKDITQVGFGGRYETALWAVALQKTKNDIVHASSGRR